MLMTFKDRRISHWSCTLCRGHTGTRRTSTEDAGKHNVHSRSGRGQYHVSALHCAAPMAAHISRSFPSASWTFHVWTMCSTIVPSVFTVHIRDSRAGHLHFSPLPEHELPCCFNPGTVLLSKQQQADALPYLSVGHYRVSHNWPPLRDRKSGRVPAPWRCCTTQHPALSRAGLPAHWRSCLKVAHTSMGSPLPSPPIPALADFSFKTRPLFYRCGWEYLHTQLNTFQLKWREVADKLS